jgi:hypothetical protein
MANHGTRTRFNQGCTDGPEGTACDPCRLANNDYFKKRAQDKKAQKLGVDPATVTSLPGADQPKVDQPFIPGPVEQGVIDALAKVPAAVEARPDLAASAKAMARIQDNPLTVAQATNAAARQYQIMTDLMKGSQKKRKLAAVRQMTNPSAAAG